MKSVDPTPLIDAATLRALLARGECISVDCRFELAAPHRGFAAYLDGHIPGARYAHLDKDLAGRVTPASGRHPLPAAEDLAACLGAWGVDAERHVVAYDDAGGAIAARLWWLLRWLGHTNVAVLDGGLAAWRRAGGPLETRIPHWREMHYEPRTVRAEWVVTTEALERDVARGAVLLDARALERYRGTTEPIDPGAGHVPGALSFPYNECLGADTTMLAHAALAERFAACGIDAGTAREVVAMCGSGVTACHVLLSLEAAGLPPGRLYAGSWSEWIRDPERPIAVGDAAD